eukprot:gnl/MRDRNA2_/MRDRNA2_47158_c0_seq1.p1 gnl/MRDRNA2_/MRDRNA2_47158_c0~~gnl/MRDRNA2_/MRDRNA2_47158_c0_seq1.p1  ORF type:complete len:235 (+),score=40.81 gnl/MRDRNA2_/MRDRNA2_47158_c0_seq1:36-707(+)
MELVARVNTQINVLKHVAALGGAVEIELAEARQSSSSSDTQGFVAGDTDQRAISNGEVQHGGSVWQSNTVQLPVRPEIGLSLQGIHLRQNDGDWDPTTIESSEHQKLQQQILNARVAALRGEVTDLKMRCSESEETLAEANVRLAERDVRLSATQSEIKRLRQELASTQEALAQRTDSFEASDEKLQHLELTVRLASASSHDPTIASTPPCNSHRTPRRDLHR